MDLGFLEVVVVGSKVAACDVLSKTPPVDEVLVVYMGGAVAAVVGDGAGAIGQGAVRSDVVGQHQVWLPWLWEK